MMLFIILSIRNGGIAGCGKWKPNTTEPLWTGLGNGIAKFPYPLGWSFHLRAGMFPFITGTCTLMTKSIDMKSTAGPLKQNENQSPFWAEKNKFGYLQVDIYILSHHPLLLL